MSDEQRIKELEDRVEKLEYQLSEMQQTKTLNDKREYVRPKNRGEQPTKKVPEYPAHDEVKEPVDWERVIGQVWLPRIFIFVLLLGVIWGFKAASEVGILNEGIRCIIGYIAGIGLVILGEYQIKKDRNALGQVLLGGSVTVLVVATFATHFLYGFIGPALAFGLNLIWIVTGIYFALRHQSEVLGILATVGGFLLPFLLDSDSANTWFFTSYETIFSIGMLVFALWKKYWKLHIVAMSLLPVVLMLYNLFAIMPAYSFESTELEILSYGMFLQHIFLLSVLLTVKVYPKVQQSVLLVSFLASIGFMYQGFDERLWRYILLGVVLLYVIVNVYTYYRKLIQLSVVMFPVLLLSMLFYFMEVFDGRELGAILLLQGTTAIYIGVHNKLRLQLWSGAFIYVIGVLNTISVQIEELNSGPMFSWTTLLITLWLLIYLSKREHEVIPHESRRLLFGTAAIGILVYISQLSNVFTQDQSISTQFLTMTICWIVYAICGVAYGVIKDNQAVRIVGIVLIFLSLGKLIFVDLPNVSMVVRAILFMIVGATGVVVSRFFYTKKKSENP